MVLSSELSFIDNFLEKPFFRKDIFTAVVYRVKVIR